MLFEPVKLVLCENWPYHSKYDILQLVLKQDIEKWVKFRGSKESLRRAWRT